MSEYREYDVERKSNGDYRVTPHRSGCGPIVCFVVIVLIVGALGKFFGWFRIPASQESKPKPTYAIPPVQEEQSAEPQNSVALPAYLADLHIYGTHTDVLDNIDSTGSVSDAYGNKYDGPYFDLCSYGPNAGQPAVEAYTDLVTGGKYMFLEGTFFCRAGQNEDFTITFQIYADGKLVFDSGKITRNSKPTYFNICIDNAEIIRVMSSSDDYTLMGTNPGIILVDAVVYNAD